MNYPEDNTNSSSNSEKGVKMMSTIKSKKSALPIDKNQRHAATEINFSQKYPTLVKMYNSEI